MMHTASGQLLSCSKGWCSSLRGCGRFGAVQCPEAGSAGLWGGTGHCLPVQNLQEDARDVATAACQNKDDILSSCVGRLHR